MKSSNKIMVLGIVFSIAVLIVIGTIVYSIINDKKEKGNEMFAYSTQQTLGKEDAPVKVVEFGDFKCPACRTWDATVFPRLKEDYINKGKVQFYFINFPFIGKDSELGAAAGEAIYKQDPDSFWKFYDEMYQSQKKDTEEWITEELLLNIVKEKLPKVNAEQFKKDLHSKEMKEKVRKDFDRAEKLKVQGAPSVYVNGNLTNPDYDSMKKEIDKELKK
ncbi:MULTISPECIES: thioredoxin domain-containing protein [unclassified Bacillus cereus group]|uniref:DsbA family protein n=1 Tax=unclassified Bacillus cereus group TaxID=2750818 RepID=UPI001F586E31|nr:MULTISPECIES: thioredoxin domain-containing protein [unclassified Bacillus cereus group]